MTVEQQLNQLGHFSKYQAYVYFISSLASFVAGITLLQNAFILATPANRCFVPNCDNSSTGFVEQFVNLTIPSGSKCTTFALTSNDNATNACFGTVDVSTTMTCSQFKYANDDFTDSAVTDFDLVCDRTRLKTISSSTFLFGNLVGAFVFGLYADRFGRRPVFFWAPLVGAAASFGVSMSTNVAMFTALSFVVSVCSSGMYISGFILGVEFIGIKYRVWCANGKQIAFALGEITLATLGYYFRRWRPMSVAIGVITGSMVALGFLLPESVRWLAINGRKEEAMAIVKRAAEVNGVTLTDDKETKSTDEPPPKANLCTILGHPLLRRWSLNVFFNWAVNAFVYYGLSLSSASFGQGLSIYVTFAMLAVIEIPFIILVTLIMDIFGRRWPLAMFMILSGICCIIAAYAPRVAVIFGTLGKGFISGSFALVYAYTAELFPTVVRATGLGTASTMARVGSIMAPIAASLDFFGNSTPALVYGVVAVIGGLLVFDLPETHMKTLPNSLEDMSLLKGDQTPTATKEAKNSREEAKQDEAVPNYLNNEAET